MCNVGSLCLQVLARNVSPAAQLEESAFLTALVDEIRAAGSSKHTIVLDVGANDGEFSEELMRTLRKRANAQPELIMVEPQPRFAAKLGRIAKRWNGTHLPVAAWTEKKELVLQENAAHSEKSSLFQKTGKFAGLEQRTVQAIDFAAYLRETLRRADIAFVKIDIEGSEYDVLPTLLLGGLLRAGAILTLESLPQLPAEGGQSPPRRRRAPPRARRTAARRLPPRASGSTRSFAASTLEGGARPARGGRAPRLRVSA